MEGIILEVTELAFVVSSIYLLGLVGIFAGIAFRHMAVEERRGARLTWAEWPIPERPTLTVVEPMRKAA